MKLSDMDILELHDAYSVMAALALESLGVVGKGEATAYAKEGEIRRGGKTPISIFGGLKVCIFCFVLFCFVLLYFTLLSFPFLSFPFLSFPFLFD